MKKLVSRLAKSIVKKSKYKLKRRWVGRIHSPSRSKLLEFLQERITLFYPDEISDRSHPLSQTPGELFLRWPVLATRPRPLVVTITERQIYQPQIVWVS